MRAGRPKWGATNAWDVFVFMFGVGEGLDGGVVERCSYHNTKVFNCNKNWINDRSEWA